MKQSLIIILALVGFSVAATEVRPQTIIYARSAAPCSFWSYFVNPNGGSGNLCSSYNYMDIPDANSVQNAVNTLENRIEALEAKIKDLERAQK